MAEHVYLRRRNEEIRRLRNDEGWKIEAIAVRIGHSVSCVSKVLAKFHVKTFGNNRKLLESEKHGGNGNLPL